MISNKEPWVTLDVVGKKINFLVDTGATYSVFISYTGPLSFSSINIMEVEEKSHTCFYTPHHPGSRQLSQERMKAIAELTPPATNNKLRSFLGMTGYGRIYIPGFEQTAKPLYEVTKGPNTWYMGTKGTHDMWTKHDQAFNKTKQTLVEAPALSIPNLNKPFSLYIAEKQGIALGFLVQ